MPLYHSLILSFILVALRGLAPIAARAQEATPATDLHPLVQQLVDAANAGDAAAVGALYVADGIHEDVPAGVVAQGPEEITAYVGGVFSQVRDLRLAPLASRHAGDLVVLEYTLSGTDVASGRPVTYRGVLVFELDGTLIRRSVDYYDLAAVLAQLGQTETGEAGPEATPAP